MSEKTRRFWEGAAMVSAEMLLSLIFFAGLLAAIVFLTRNFWRRQKPFDLKIFDIVTKWATPANNRFMLFITFLGKHQFLIPANLLLLGYFLFIYKQTWFSIRVIAIALSSLLLMVLLKNLFRRKRPLTPLLKAARGKSFPSGHAIMAVTFFGIIIYILTHEINNAWIKAVITTGLVLLIILIGFSRIYLRVHYFSDVMAGFIIGILWLFISLKLLEQVEQYNKKKLIAPAAINGFNHVHWLHNSVSLSLPA
jgi:membrane-associated phospholipid phosphatase